MAHKITLCDYSMDWAMKEYYIDERTSPGYLTREDIIQYFGTMGVDAVELGHAYWAECPPAYVKAVCEEAGLPIYGYTVFVDLVEETPAQRQAAVDKVRHLLDRAADLSAKVSMIVPVIFKEGIAFEQQRAWLIEGLHCCAEHAHGVDVQLACENLDYPPARPFLGTGQDCHDICAAVNHPGFRLILDCCAPLFLEEDPLAALKAMQPFLCHVHLKNSRPLYPGERVARYRDSISGKRLTGTILDGGLVPIPAVMAELDRIGYDGYIQLEYQGEGDPQVALRYNLDYYRRQAAED